MIASNGRRQRPLELFVDLSATAFHVLAEFAVCRPTRIAGRGRLATRCCIVFEAGTLRAQLSGEAPVEAPVAQLLPLVAADLELSLQVVSWLEEAETTTSQGTRSKKWPSRCAT